MRRFHKTLGLIMLLPFIAWAITGVFFFIKPGYQQAYQQLSVKTYPLTEQLGLLPEKEWLEVKLIRSLLGLHILAKDKKGWGHYQMDKKPTSIAKPIKLFAVPSPEALRAIIDDAIESDRLRYGQIIQMDASDPRKIVATTDTQVKVSLDWQTLRLSQKGKDTDWINQMYKIHYLQWTGIQAVDKVLGIVGLFLVLLLAGLGCWMTFSRRAKRRWR